MSRPPFRSAPIKVPAYDIQAPPRPHLAGRPHPPARKAKTLYTGALSHWPVREVAEKLVQHKHCKMCGKAISPDDEVCSEACGKAREAQLKSRKNTMYLFYASIVILVVVLALSLSGSF